MSKISISYPANWLSPAISVVNMTTEVQDFSGTMTEIGSTKVYTYEFTEVSNTDYAYVITTTWYTTFSGALFYEAWAGGGLTTEEHDRLFTLPTSAGGGFSSQSIRASIGDAKREIIQKIEEIPSKIPQVSLENIENQINENLSQIDIAKEEIIDTIKSSENEICSDIVRKSKELKEDNVKTRNLVRQKSEKIVKYAEKQLDRQEKIEKMIDDESEEIESLIEQNIEYEADEIEKDINKQIDYEIEEIESNLPNNGNNNGTEG